MEALSQRSAAIEFLTRASELYYSGKPIISDYQFDILAAEYGFDTVGAKPGSAKTGRHYQQMYSLQKYYEDEGFDNPLSGITDISYSPKLDGAAISLLYYNGMLIQALTRGDGIEGQLITDKVYINKSVPTNISGLHLDIFQVTGEIVASKEIKNSRNYAAGALNLKDLEEFKTRAITFVAHDCYPSVCSLNDNTYDANMSVLSRMGFCTVKDPELHNIYPTDGIVYRVNNNEIAQTLGYTSKHPRFAYALKERQNAVETQILEVEWNVGRSGRITPIAILKPIMIDGKEVSRATLNNPGFIEALDLRIGDTVAVRLAGMIIPEIVHKVDA
jgi:DNA ligase (NAD+)